MGYCDTNFDLGYIGGFISHVQKSFETHWPSKEELRKYSIEDLEKYCEMISGLDDWFARFLESFQGNFNKHECIFFDDFKTKEDYHNKWETISEALGADKNTTNSEKAAWYLWHFIDKGVVPHWAIADIRSPLHLYKVLFPEEKVSNRDDIPDWRTCSGLSIDDGSEKKELEEIEKWLNNTEDQKTIKKSLGVFLEAYEQVKEWLPEYAAEMEAYEQELIEGKKQELEGLLTNKDILGLVAKQMNAAQEKATVIKPSSYSCSESVSELIAQDEGQTLEFKETFQYNIRSKQIDKDVRHDALKTIAGFLNANGGTLLIGISDRSKIKGIAIDKKAMNNANNDKFELNIRNHITGGNSKFIPPAISYVEFKFEELQNHIICIINVQPLPKSEILHFDKAVYVRDGNETLKLTGVDLTGWIKLRTGKK